jgi:hypothetical protein
MPSSLPAHLLELVSEALLKSFWRKRALSAFLRREGIKESFLATWQEEETKRDFLYRLFPVLEKTDSGVALVQRMAADLSQQVSFPDLEGWEDASQKKLAATAAVTALRKYVSAAREVQADERAQVEARRRAAQMREEARRRQSDLQALTDRLALLARRLGEQQAGYDFEAWFYDLVDYFEVLCRRPYVVDGRQVDGTITIDGTTYLVELKFSFGPAGGPDVDVLFKKVHDKLDNTMGVLVAISGYTRPALDGASGPRALLLLMDHAHLYKMLSGSATLAEVVTRLRRHASQTGRGYLSAADM